MYSDLPVCFKDQLGFRSTAHIYFLVPLTRLSSWHLVYYCKRGRNTPERAWSMIDMDWHPVLDCGSHPFGHHGMHAILRPPSPSNVMEWYTHPTPSFERNFCSNFTCCGQSLADLHALVDHCQEAHVVMIGPDDTHVWPSAYRMGSNPDSPFCSYRSVIRTEPEPEPDWADPRLSIETHGRCTSLSRTDTLAAEFDVVNVTNGEFMSDPAEVCLPPSSFTAKMERNMEVQPETSDRTLSACPASGYINPRIGKKRPRVPGVSRGRGKSYKCPRPGCTKSYLNANGLKYHLEKGTCSVKPKSALQLVEALGSG